MAGTDSGSGNSCPATVIPERGKVPANPAECSQNRLPRSVSHTSRAGFHFAISFCTECTCHILPNDHARFEHGYRFPHLHPQVGPSAFLHAATPAGMAQIL